MPPPTDDPESRPDPALALPDPETLEEVRQGRVRERFAVQVGTVALVVAVYVNLFGGLVGTMMLGWTPGAAVTGAFALAGLPVVGILALLWWRQRHARAVRKAIGALLDVEPPKRWLQLVVLGVSLFAGVLVYLNFDAANNVPLGVAFLVLSIVGPGLRRASGSDLPAWALAFSSGWIAMGGLLVIGLTALLGKDPGFFLGLAWIFLAPFGLPVYLLRHRIGAATARGDRVGRIARLWAVYLPPAQAAELARVSGDAEGAMELLRKRMSLLRSDRQLAEGLGVAGRTLLEIGDPRAMPTLAGAARLTPDTAEPFALLARALRGTDVARARAYARFAEENAARSIAGIPDELQALRAELDAVEP